MVGQQVARTALSDGHDVVAVVHSRDPFTPDLGLTVTFGDVSDPAMVASALTGSDAVISTLITRAAPATGVLATGMRTIKKAIGILGPGSPGVTCLGGSRGGHGAKGAERYSRQSASAALR
jgi:putative NADH-flavin reductase